MFLFFFHTSDSLNNHSRHVNATLFHSSLTAVKSKWTTLRDYRNLAVSFLKRSDVIFCWSAEFKGGNSHWEKKKTSDTIFTAETWPCAPASISFIASTWCGIWPVTLTRPWKWPARYHETVSTATLYKRSTSVSPCWKGQEEGCWPIFRSVISRRSGGRFFFFS